MPRKYLNILGEDKAVKNNKTNESIAEKLTPDVFRSPLVIIAAAIFAVGAVFSLISLALLADPSYRTETIYQIVSQDVADMKAIMTWFYLIVIVKALFAVFSVTFAAGMLTVVISAARCKGNP